MQLLELAPHERVRRTRSSHGTSARRSSYLIGRVHTWGAEIRDTCFAFRRLQFNAECSLRPLPLASPHCARRTQPVAASAAQLVRRQTDDVVQRTLCIEQQRLRARDRAQTIHGKHGSACQARALHGHPLPAAPSRSLKHGRSSSPLPIPLCSRC